MRHIPALLTIAILVAACSPAPPKDTASERTVSESNRSSIVIPAADSSAAMSISSSDGACLSEIGKAASNRLVERCIMVSPATHPPCNAANSCQMIQDEIDRSCAMYGPDETKPKECAA
jgi:hypothetical protein